MIENQPPKLWPTEGLVGGLVIQFARGRWQEEIGDGVALNEAAFDLVEPHLANACSQWTSMHRYGVLEISAEERRCLSKLLKQHKTPANKTIFCGVSEWLDVNSRPDLIVSVLGI